MNRKAHQSQRLVYLAGFEIKQNPIGYFKYHPKNRCEIIISTKFNQEISERDKSHEKFKIIVLLVSIFSLGIFEELQESIDDLQSKPKAINFSPNDDITIALKKILKIRDP
jgi:hypothetical protein